MLTPWLVLPLLVAGPSLGAAPPVAAAVALDHDLAPSITLETAPAGGALAGDDELFEEALQLLREERLREAERALRALVAEDPDHAYAHFLLAYTVHVRAVSLRDTAERERLLIDALSLHLDASAFENVRPTALYNAACASALLGRKDTAFEYLDQAFEHGFDGRSWLPKDPDLASLRDDPRFEAYLPVEDRAKLFKGEVRVLHTFLGESAGDKFGWEACSAGDCDADGTPDMVISAPFKDVDGPDAGRVYVFSGRTGALLFARSGVPGSLLGWSVAAAGDVNGDGHDDVLASATFGGNRAGVVSVLSGADGSTLRKLSTRVRGDRFGNDVVAVGDFDGDGVDEILVGAPGSDEAGAEAGRAYLFSGATGDLLLAIDGEEAGDEFGTSVAGVVTEGDRLLAVGAGNAGPGDRGRVHAFEYADGEVTERFRIEADRTGARLGQMFLSFVGDVNGDRYADLYAADVGNNARGPKTGRAYVLSGRDGKVVLSLTGEHQGEAFGSGPAVAGDVDGDGFADLIIGSWRSDQGGQGAGKCTVYSATTEVLLEVVCTAAGDAFGFEAVGLGDLDGDGGVDFLVTAARSNFNGRHAGRAFVIAGPRPACTDTDAVHATVRER